MCGFMVLQSDTIKFLFFLNSLVLRNQSTKEEKVIFLTKEQQSESSFFFDTNTKTELEIISKVNKSEKISENINKRKTRQKLFNTPFFF